MDRTGPILPLQPGLADRRSHDYVRHGTSTLFAALEIATGQVTAACKPRHRHQEFLAFLKQVARAYPDDGTGRQLHLVMDNYAAHKHSAGKAWLAANPRVHCHRVDQDRGPDPSRKPTVRRPQTRDTRSTLALT